MANKKWWSEADIEHLKNYIDNYGREEGMKLAAQYFKVTKNAVNNKLWRIENNKNIDWSKDKKTHKVPIVRKGSTKNISEDKTIILSFQDIEVDLKNKKLIIKY